MDWIDGDFQRSTFAWEQQLGINATRISCRVTIHNTPDTCVDFVKSLQSPSISKYFLYIQTDPATLPTDMLRYSILTADVPSIASVGIDDFFGYYQTWYTQMPNAASFVGQVIDNGKTTNKNLKFGITLYENELDSIRNPYIDDRHLPPEIKAKFDYIHLFLHYRKNGSNFAAYVAQAQHWFPNAKIIAGVYAYDRIDYFPCAQNDSSKKPCTTEEEITYFKIALDTQMQLLKEAKVASLEIFPGYFGAEDKLYGPGTDNLTCQNVTRCIQNTMTMRDMILSKRRQFAGVQTSVNAADSVPTPRIFPNPWRADKHDHQPITFDLLYPNSTVKIFTVSGRLIATLPSKNSSASWDLMTDSGKAAASGLYLYLIANDAGQHTRGQLAVVR